MSERLDRAVENHSESVSEYYKLRTDFNIYKVKVQEEIREARADAIKRNNAVTRGQYTEHLAPFMQTQHNPRDYRFIGNPIDYLVIVGSADLNDGRAQTIEEIQLVEIKTASSQLTKIQREIRNAILGKRISFVLYNPDTQTSIKWKTDGTKEKLSNNNNTGSGTSIS
jgi:predicted Holliday junction resolvase-like endonuclease